LFSIPGAGVPFAAWDAAYGFDAASGIWLSKNNGLIFNQPTPANLPTRNASSANFAGKPSLSTTATQGMQNTLASSAWNFLHNGNGMSFYTAQRLTDTASNLPVYTSVGSYGFAPLMWNAAGGCFLRVANGPGAYWVNQSTATMYNISGVFGFRSSLAAGARYKLHTGAWTACTTSGSPASNNAEVTLRYGYFGSNQFVGEMAEILIFDRYHSDEEAAAVYSYLAGKYGW
jgi:hypothetical protein